MADRVIAGDSLAESEALFRAVLDNLAEGVVVQDASGRIVSSNPAAQAILGLSVDELTGLTSVDPRWDVVREDGSPYPGDEHPAMITLSTGAAVTDAVMGVRRPSGDTRWLTVNSRPIRDASGDRVTGAVASFRDVTEERRVTQSLLDRAAFLGETEDLADAGSWAYDLASHRVSWSDAMYRIYEVPRDYDPNDVQGNIDFVELEDRPRINSAFQLLVEEGTPYDLEVRFITGLGRKAWVRTNAFAQIEAGRVVRVHGHVQDITDRKRAEETEVLARGRLQRFVDSDIIGVVMGNAAGKVIEANDYYLDLLGVTREELERGAVDWRAFTPADWMPADERAIAELRERGVCPPYEKEYLRRDGRRVPVLLVDALLPGESLEIVALVLDITDLKRAEEALRRSEQEFHTLAEAMPQMVWTTRPDGWNTYFNQHWVEYTGLALDESYGEGWSTPFHSDDRERAQEAWRLATSTGGRYELEVRLRRADGAYRWWLIRGVPLREADGTILKWFGTCTDIDDIKQTATTNALLRGQLEEELEQRRRVETEIRDLNVTLERRVLERTAALEAANLELEAFSYSVSHDLRAPLRHIDSFSQILVNKHADLLDAEAQLLLGKVVHSAKQMGVLVDDLLAFSRVARKELDSRPVNMDLLVRSVCDDLRRGEPDRLLEFDVGPVYSVPGDQALLRQVWINLLENAVKFTLRTARPRIEVRCERLQGVCRYTVRDNGAGFDTTYAGKLFQPFQRLHKASEFEGNGIGLAIVARIVQRHGGEVWAEGTSGAGAMFGFSLPEKTEPK